MKNISAMPKVETDKIKQGVNFSDEEQKIFDLLLRDKSLTEIAIATRISPRTVSRRVGRIKLKIDKFYD